ncbi:hypothetical protein Tco_0326316, partial [Tanacetum coccineum]
FNETKEQQNETSSGSEFYKLVENYEDLVKDLQDKD